MPIDQDAIEHLTVAFAATIKQHYLDRPRSPDTALEVLNALAAMTATVVAGTGSDHQFSFDFFIAAYRLQIEAAPDLEDISL